MPFDYNVEAILDSASRYRRSIRISSMTFSIFTVLVGLALIFTIISLVNGKVPLAVAVLLICIALLFPK